ncbi:hypothetical protein [Paenarthrobacter sp. NPDC091669]|uniref:hypothetical protein n=1 Tax=Paenarthrobacter sp. NPDC091669 TaxID=3364384 RepID=UPI0037FFB3A5
MPISGPLPQHQVRETTAAAGKGATQALAGAELVVGTAPGEVLRGPQLPGPRQDDFA